MTTLMAVFTCESCSSALLRHWPFFLGQGADDYRVIVTTSPCQTPPEVKRLTIGNDTYIDGPALPKRMLDTIGMMLSISWDVLILIEYDTLIINPIPVEKVTTVASYRAGGPTWGSKAKAFYHNPWVFNRLSAELFLIAGKKALLEGICPDRARHEPSTPECSPDVFFGYVCESIILPVQDNLWTEYSRNQFDIPGHLEEARAAYRNGIDVIHGIKTQEQLDFVIG